MAENDSARRDEDPIMAINFSSFIPCWSSLSLAEQRLMEGNTTVKSYASGGNIYINQTKKDGMIFVLSGNVRVYISSARGREITLFHIRSGEVFCIMTIDRSKEGDVLPALQMQEKGRVAYVPRNVLEAIAYRVPDMALFIFNQAADVAQGIINQCSYYFFNTLRGCIARLIVENSSKDSDIVQITHENIANSLATTRVVISRELQALCSIGLIETHRGFIRVLDWDGLVSFAENS